MEIRAGIGYDVHRLEKQLELIIGGVKIPHDYGLLAHSDGDVLVHSIMDAILGAASLGDIGQHFPDRDPAYRGISSLILLGRVLQLIHNDGWNISNIDSVITAQKPRIAPHIPLMQQNLAETLNISPDRIGIKATTTEGLGFEGRELGISARSVCLLYRG